MNPDERYQQLRERKKERADVHVPVESGDRVSVSAVSGIHDWMLDSVDGYPIEGTVGRVDYLTEGCRNLGSRAVVRVTFTEDECPAVHGGTTEIYPVGGSRRSWDELPVERVD
jgi:hypothetical protein